MKSIFLQVGITFFGFWLVDQVLPFVICGNWFPVLNPRLYDFATYRSSYWWRRSSAFC